MISILRSTTNIIGEGGGKSKPIWPLNEHMSLHCDNAQDIHTSSKNYEESGDDLDLDLPTTLC